MPTRIVRVRVPSTAPQREEMKREELEEMIEAQKADIEQYKGVQKRYGSGRWAHYIVERLEERVAKLKELESRLDSLQSEPS